MKNIRLDVGSNNDNAVSAKKENQKPFEKTGKLSPEQVKNMASSYKRIGTEYYLYATILTAKKEPVKILKRWTKTTIKEDHGTKIFDEIEKFIDFALVPDNTENYRRNMGGCYNIYEPIQFKPEKGNFPNTEKFLSHIFGDYLDIGLDYLTILFNLPAEKLPALSLVSKEQNTGKTTFLRWLNKIYGDNAVILGNEDFASNFNTSWVSKLIIGIDESFIEKRIIKEKIKRLVTDDTALAENKGVDKVRRDFIGKFVLLSNNEDNFIQMEKEDNRFFVLKIPTVPKEDPFLGDKLKSEIPAFLYFLSQRELMHRKESRLWFKPEDYETEALRNVVKSSKTILEKTMIDTLSDFADNIKVLKEYEEFNSIKISPMRLADVIKESIKYSNGLHIKIVSIFKNWKLNHVEKPGRYKYPVFENELRGGISERVLHFKGEVGKYYTIPFSKIESLIND